MISLTLTSLGSTLSGMVNIDGIVLSSKLSSAPSDIQSLSVSYLDYESKGNIYSDSFRLAIVDDSSETYTAYSIILYTTVSNVKKAIAYYTSDQPIITKTADAVHKYIQFENFSSPITGIILQSIASAARSGSGTTDGLIHIEDTTTSLDDNYSVYSKSQVDSLIPKKVSDLTDDVGIITTETDPTVPSWAKANSKPSYNLDEVSDGTTRKLSNYVPTTRKINDKALSSDITLSLDDVADGTNRKIPTKVSDLSNDTGFITSSALSGYVQSSSLKEGAYVDVDETTMTSSSTNLPTSKAVASYITSLSLATTSQIPSNVSDLNNDSGYITSSSLPTVNNTTITIKKNSDDTGDSFTTNASSTKVINLGLSSVATSGSYSDLSNKPTIPTVNNATLTIKKNSDDSGTTFTANASTDVTANLGLATIATSGSYSDLSNKPTIPTVNNTAITIKKNSDDTGDSFTTNASSTKTINLGLATVATSGSYNDLTDKPTIPSGGSGEIDYLSLIGKPITIGATGEVGVVYQPVSTYEFPHYEHTTDYSTLNSSLVSNGWTLTNNWVSTNTYIDNGVIYYNGKVTTETNETKYYKTHSVISYYSMSQIEQAIVDSGNTSSTFSSNYNNSITLTSGDPGYDSSGNYNSRTYIYSAATDQFTVSGYGSVSGALSVPVWKYQAINTTTDYIGSSDHWIFSAGLGIYYDSMNSYSLNNSSTSLYINGYSFDRYDNWNGYWYKTTTWNSSTQLPYGGTEEGYFIQIIENTYSTPSNDEPFSYDSSNWEWYMSIDTGDPEMGTGASIYRNLSNSADYQYYNDMSYMYGSDPYNCNLMFPDGGGTGEPITNYYYVFCDVATLYAFINNGGYYSHTESDYTT